MPDQSQHTLDAVAEQFVIHRPKLYAIAYRTLGSPWSADDAVQEAWLRLQRSDVTAMFTTRSSVGTMQLYADTPDTFDHQTRNLGHILTAHASIVWNAAHRCEHMRSTR